MDIEDAKQYAESRLKEIKSERSDIPMVQIVTRIIQELKRHHNFRVHFNGRFLESVSVSPDGVPIYHIELGGR